MFRNIWFEITDPDFFLPCLFVCISLAMAIKLWYWKKKKPWAIWVLDQLLDLTSCWILICVFVQVQIWKICWPALPMGIWGSVPYAVFLVFYLLRKREAPQEVKPE